MNRLPQPIADFVAANNAMDPQRIAAAFNLDATVFDEGHLRRGRDDIAAWASDYVARYQSTIEPTGVAQAGDEHVVRATVRGTFPGSPIALDFHFRLQGDGIQSLEVTA
ncbi:nuclear transport factor 2 family protein [Massilia sp. G4R7]|uniref:Nuclear transport factor 2 family protein n=1 Tax=Massilia phyllostachyos TaxID=2898585 RepID=A0ABS8QDQ3_9BURK|nr:nuclear transport factor 2 family protein [Massilia phyllostachyos]MCD2519166.1 nuclear transport factor 2 family protein [Massilia phyllostachyos]